MMEIVAIKQTDSGVQKRPYADHIYEWSMVIYGVTDMEELLQFCQTYLRHAVLPHDEYFKQYRDSSLSFEEHMKIVCGGWYKLEETEKFHYKYTVHEEYID